MITFSWAWTSRPTKSTPEWAERGRLREECPNCGAELPAAARVCPECGSDENTGWSEAATEQSLGVPDDSFNYDEFVRREFEGKAPTRRRLDWFWWLVAVVLVGALVWWFVSFR